MTLILSGSDGVSDIDGSASTPAIRGTDANTGIFFPAADRVGVSTGGTQRIEVDSSGNVGIGTSSPVNVANYTTLTINDTTGGIIYLQNNGTNVLQLAADNKGANVTIKTNTPLLFATNDTERARITSGGDVGINNTGLTGCRFGVSEDGSVRNAMGINNTASGSTSHAFVSFQRNTTQTGTISNTNSATAYNTSSDYRLKENIAPMTGALDVVQQLKPVTYNWKIDGSAGQGFIAHELQAVVPDAVTGEKDAVDADGNPQYQGVDTSFLVATLTAAIQELKAINDAQASRIETLEAKVAALEAK